MQILLKKGTRGEKQGDFTDNSTPLHVFEKMKSSPIISSTFQEEINIYILKFSLKSCLVEHEFHLLFGALSPFYYCLQGLATRGQTLKTQYEHVFNNFFITPLATHLINYVMLGFRVVQGAHGYYRLRGMTI